MTYNGRLLGFGSTMADIAFSNLVESNTVRFDEDEELKSCRSSGVNYICISSPDKGLIMKFGLTGLDLVS